MDFALPFYSSFGSCQTVDVDQFGPFSTVQSTGSVFVEHSRLVQCPRGFVFVFVTCRRTSIVAILLSSVRGRKDLFLSSTAIRLGYSASGFSVPTPPLQPFLPVPVLPVALGQGGVWDDALEIEDIDSV